MSTNDWAQHAKRRLTFREAFFCGGNGEDKEDTSQTLLRYAVVSMGVILSATIVFLWKVILTDRSAVHHTCEHNYVLWPMAIAYQVIFHAILLTYVFNRNTSIASATDVVFGVALTAILGWYFLVYFRMAHICLTFYTIKYPVLLAAPHVCGPVGILVWIATILRRISAGMYDTETDPVMLTELFYKDNESFLPPLFETAKIQSYQKGVTTWSESIKGTKDIVGNTKIKGRNETLKEAYDAAYEIHKSTKGQSALLSQIGQFVEEAETKANKVSQELDNQENLIKDLQGAVNDAENQLSTMNAKKGSMRLGCSRWDYVAWAAISIGCCAVCVFALLAVPKWLHLFGITLGIHI